MSAAPMHRRERQVARWVTHAAGHCPLQTYGNDQVVVLAYLSDEELARVFRWVQDIRDRCYDRRQVREAKSTWGPFCSDAFEEFQRRVLHLAALRWLEGQPATEQATGGSAA